ncbi:hypothetical protein J22TS3_39630 [Paenibacillus sp. J22TS3]|nr:hypothetical protein J22TS3_39630 [Paenibacillus sp. J22TS3]
MGFQSLQIIVTVGFPTHFKTAGSRVLIFDWHEDDLLKVLREVSSGLRLGLVRIEWGKGTLANDVG